VNDADYTLIGRRIEQLYGIDLDCYKSTQMRRRLDAYLLRVKAASWAEYFRRVETEATERQRFKDYLTINVTSFFRDADKFQVLEKQVLPPLLAAGRALNIWSAGCSDGPEPYTLAMLLTGISPGTRFHIWATDLDPTALAKAKARGPYLPDSVESVPKPYLSRFFDAADGVYRVKTELQRNITFQEHNILRDPIKDHFDLIVCRNVIIYFTEDAKLGLFARFTQALKPDGVLFIGATETIPISQARDLGLEPVRVSFYRRLQTAKVDIGAR
jgi:chemotaxis protein methyltransferase CheR